jgi:Fe2+ or Zn2+ uptake regulation protein
MKKSLKTTPENTLRTFGQKATKDRLALLSILEKASAPLSVHRIREKTDDAMAETTIYRTMETFSDLGIVKKIDFQHGHAHYELALGIKHHHHLVCTSCGKIEDIGSCTADDLAKHALKKSKQFTVIEYHSLEFFGTCLSCERTLKKGAAR